MTELSVDFIQDLIREEYPSVVVKSLEGAHGSKRGDNYTSMVYRLTVQGVKKHLEADGSAEREEPWHTSLIYKRLPESIIRREAFKSDELFCNEVAFYNKIWPALSAYQDQFNIRNPFRAIPKCYLAQNDMVILKDLKEDGFVMPDRRQGLSMEQFYFVLKQLAQFHALSLAMKYGNPDAFFELLNMNDGIGEVFFIADNEEYFRKYYQDAIRNAIEMVDEELSDSPKKDFYLNKFKEFCKEDNFFPAMVEHVTPKEPLAVICHGDCWTNNLLFRYSNGEIAEMYIVDFQLVRYGSPALDLIYLAYLCLDRAQRADHLPSALQYYTDQLHTRLLELSDENSVFRGSLNRGVLGQMIQEEIHKHGGFGLGIALDMYPIMTCDSAEAPNLYQAKEKESSGQPQEVVSPVNTTNAACRRKMTDLLRELVDGQQI